MPGERWTTRYNDVPFKSVYPFGHGLGYTVDKIYRVEPSDFEAWIAPDSDSGKRLTFTL